MEHTPSLVWGDACDPVPCPDEVGQSSVGEVVSQLDTDHFWFRCRDKTRDEIAIRPLLSHTAEGAPGPSLSLSGVDTHARFCHVDSGLQHMCDESTDIQDMRLLDADCAPTLNDPAPCASVEQPGHAFHRMAFSSGGNGMNPNGPAATLGYSVSHTDPTSRASWTWDYAADIARWRAFSFFSPTGAPPTGLVDVFRGTVWTHAATTTGAVPGPTGVHGLYLANHHENGFKPKELACHFGTDFVAAPEYFFLWLTLPDPAPTDFLRVDGWHLETSIIAYTGNEYGAVDQFGEVEMVTNRLGPALRASLADSTLVWASLAEPFAGMGGDANFPMAVALSENGSQHMESVTSTGSLLLGLGDAGVPGANLVGSPNAHGFIPVLSSTHHGIFVVGGDHPMTGQPTGEIWFTQLVDGEWTPVVTDFVVENVLAATYNFATHELFVLDESGGRVRLTAIDQVAGTSRSLGTWDHDPRWHKHWLVTDRDGSLLLASSRTGSFSDACEHNGPNKKARCQQRPLRHAIARIDVASPSPRLIGTHRGHRPLELAPVVDRSGYTVVTSRNNNRIRMRRWDQLPLMPKNSSLGPLSWQL